MTDEITIASVPDAPEGYAGETGVVHPDPGFVGITEHGAVDIDRITPADFATIRSAVWGNRTVPINTYNGQRATWDPCIKGRPCPPPNSCADGCCWYDFSTGVCLPHCTHPGMDIGVLKHTALYAAQGGLVEFAGDNQYYRPYHVKIRAPNGDLHLYGHLWSIDSNVVKDGQIQTGQYLGTSGEQTVFGSTTVPDGSGPHLHFEQRPANGCSVDPTLLLTRANVVLHCSPNSPPPFDGRPKQVGNVVFHPDQRTVKCSFEGLGCRRWANIQACTTRNPLTKGERIDVLYWIVGENILGENRWWVAEDGTRLHAGGTVEKPSGA
jgi:hypothetical protein